MIVSKLGTYRRQNRTNKALWEFDNIIKSLYMLDYVDPPVRRSNVYKALNRGEAYHRLRRAIAYAP
ncbi:MAG: transposase [Candidatus Thiodiazotropha sp. (ex Lucina pensylvanica)]|nr:transposase [Candidatus Thiodiazotropha sp. (ex Lucina pensylvanica)]